MRELGTIEYRRYAALLGLAPDDALSPVERGAAVPEWMNEHLVATLPARNKLRAWARSTPRDEWDVAPDPAAVLVALHSVGDPVWPHAIAKALCRVPPPVRAYLIRSVTWCPAGLAFAGWCGARPEFGDRPWFIVLSRGGGQGLGELQNLVGHEAGHAWRDPDPAPEMVLALGFWMQTVFDLPMDEVLPESRAVVAAMRAEAEREEGAVRALARSWGFGDL